MTITWSLGLAIARVVHHFFSHFVLLRLHELTFDFRLVDIDDFMAGLWKVHLAVKEEGYAQVLLSPLRSNGHLC